MSLTLLLWLACGPVHTAEPPAPTAPLPVAPPPAPAAPEPLPPPTEPRYAASHIVLSGEDRQEEAAELRRQALAGSAFDELARARSDGPSAPRGGYLGTFQTGTMVPEFESAVASVKVGEIGPVVHTSQGWHVVRREAVERARVQHLIVRWDGAWRSDDVGRSREEAAQRVAAARQRIAGGEPFRDVAAELSDSTDIDLGWVARDTLPPVLDAALFDLAPAALSAVIETESGLHLLYREP